MKSTFKSFLFLALTILINTTKGDMNSQCTVCFAQSNFVSYCLNSLDTASGLCCLTASSGTNDCQKTQYFCTSSLQSQIQYHKYAMCAFDSSKCGSKKRILTSMQQLQSIYTALDFNNNDICPYQIVTDSLIPFNTKIQITLKAITNANVFLLSGSSITNIQSQEELTLYNSISISGELLVILIIVPTSKNPFVQFTYQNVPALTQTQWIGIICGSVAGYSVLVLILLCIISKKVTQKQLNLLMPPPIYSKVPNSENQKDFKPNIQQSGPPQNMNNKIKPDTPLQNFNHNNEMPYNQPNQSTQQDMHDAMHTQEGMSQQNNNRPPPFNNTNQNNNNRPPITRNSNNFGSAQNPNQNTSQNPQQNNQLQPPNENQNRRNSAVSSNSNQGMRPKVQIRPYKLTFD